VFRRDIVPERLRRAAVTTTTEPFQVSR